MTILAQLRDCHSCYDEGSIDQKKTNVTSLPHGRMAHQLWAASMTLLVDLLRGNGKYRYFRLTSVWGTLGGIALPPVLLSGIPGSQEERLLLILVTLCQWKPGPDTLKALCQVLHHQP